VHLLVLADTHIRTGGSRTLPDEVWEAARSADAILHAGDVMTAGLLEDLGRYAPVHAVLGNNDVDLTDLLPETLELEFAGVSIAMIHDSGTRAGRPARMQRRFPDAHVVVYGHSHLPDNSDNSEAGGQLLFNPGSCTERRRAPSRTYGVLDLHDAAVRSHLIVEI